MATNNLDKSNTTDPSILTSGSFKLDHIGIAVKNLTEAIKLYTTLLDLKESSTEILTNQQIQVCFLTPNNPNNNSPALEIISPTCLSDNSPVAKFIKTKGEGLHHICYSVNNISLAIENFKKNGAMLLEGYPISGSRGKIIAFFHPKSTNGVLIEFCSKS